MIINSPWMKNSRKSAAGMSTAQSRGQTVARQKPTTVANPQTEAQTLQRQRTRRFSEIASQFKSIVRPGFKNLKPGRTALSEFQSLNVMTVTDGSTVGNILVDYGVIQIAKGSTRGVAFSRSPSGGGASGIVTVDFQDVPGYGGNPTDKIAVAVYNPVNDTLVAYDTTATRADGTVAVPVPTGTPDPGLWVYIYAIAEDGTPSNSSAMITA